MRKKFLVRMERELTSWLDREAKHRDRSRSWMLSEAVRQWRKRLERERASRKAKAARKVKSF